MELPFRFNRNGGARVVIPSLPYAFCEKGIISKLTTKKFCVIAVRLLSPPYCLELKRFFRSGGRARIVAAGFLSIGSGKSNVGYRGKGIGADRAEGAIERGLARGRDRPAGVRLGAGQHHRNRSSGLGGDDIGLYRRGDGARARSPKPMPGSAAAVRCWRPMPRCSWCSAPAWSRWAPMSRSSLPLSRSCSPSPMRAGSSAATPISPR